MNHPAGNRPLPRAVRSLAGLALGLARSWWPQVAALAAACAVVATTITGALGVGASLTRGLRDLATERLGAIDAAVVADEPFTAGLAARLEESLATAGPGRPARVVPALVLSVAVEAAGGGGPRAASRATLLACDDPAALGFPAAPAVPRRDAVLVNGPLATALPVRPGDALVVRVPERSTVPSDTPLGRRTAESRGRRLTVGAVLPEAGLGRFSLRPVQVTGPLIVTSLETARAILRRGDVLNTVFAVAPPQAGPDRRTAAAGLRGAAAWLAAALEPDLADYGLAIEAAGSATPAWRLVSRRLVLPAEVDRAATAVLAPLGGAPALVFLANSMAPIADAAASATGAASATAGRAASIPYSTVAGVPGPPLPSGDLVDEAGAVLPPVPPDGIVIDRWMADDLAAQGTAVAPGALIELRLFLPETVDGRVEETTARLRIAGIAAMRGAALARDLVPEVEGITDEASIADWDPPFPFDRSRVRAAAPDDQDDRYWKQYGATPKAFVDLATARRLAGSRFGETTTWHVPRERVDNVDSLRRTLAAELRPAALGIRIEPLRDDALAAARGSTPFGGLFLALSSFLVAAGLLLEWLLFQLLVAARRRDVGVLAAVGWPPGRLATLLVLVGGAAAVGGVALGTLLGPAWASALVAVLGRSWATQVAGGSVAAFAAGPARLAEIWPGAVAALTLSLGAMAWAAWRAGRVAPLALLRERDDPARGRLASPRLVVPLAGLALAAAAASAWAGRTAEWQTAVGLFFGAGMLALVGLLALVRAWLGTAAAGPPRTLVRLARRGLSWRPGRAFSVAAIVAVAQFLIVAVSSFAVRPPADPEDRASPTGGWTALVTFGEPTMVDPTDPDTRAGLGLPATAEEVLAGCTIARLRTSSGDDAACTNLYAAGRPTVLGVGRDFVARGGFRFVAHERPAAAAARGAIDANPWRLLETDRPPDAPLPAILDQATAQWALKLGGLGGTFTLTDGAGRDVTLRIVGLLDTSILQGTVIVAERDFQRLFPARSGYGMALVDAGGVAAARRGGVGPALAAAWADSGTSVEGAADRLRSLLAVQNTFLAGFQALGTLGLFLGTAGVAAVQLQNVLERRGQLALLRAVGFTTGRVRGLLVIETLLTVGLGLVAGTLAALLAVAPLVAAQAGFAVLPLGWIAATCGLSLGAALLAGLAATSRHTIPVRPQAD
jgi:putative ABC transport system permease protein